MSESPPRTTGSDAETRRLGEALAPHLEVGDLVVLSGPLGAGKTCFVQGLARGLECHARVRSPSFSLVNEYHGRILLVHLDLYRAVGSDAESLGLEEYRERGALVAEWGERLPVSLREDALALVFGIVSAAERRIVARASVGRGLALLAAWQVLALAGETTPRAAPAP